MPVVMEQGSSGRSYALLPGVHCAPVAASMRGEGISVGIVNNMPDSALELTERQFIGLLAAASGRMPVRVRLFSLAGIPRAETARHYVETHYADIRELWDANFDALIVTGTEPRDALPAEPYWPAFCRLVDWAARNTTSTIWSCLAAHAAVLRLDSIERVAFPDKCFGVFECERALVHPLTGGAALPVQVPHSRWNDLREVELSERGYHVLSRGDLVGADLFIKDIGSLFIFLQGHPEYEPQTLLREYRRDVGRFLRGERETYPTAPQRYFDEATEQILDEFRAMALAAPSERLLESFPATALREPLVRAWRSAALRFYRNWLATIVSRRKSATSGSVAPSLKMRA